MKRVWRDLDNSIFMNIMKRYSRKETAEFLLSNAVSKEDFENIKQEIKKMGINISDLTFYNPYKR